MELIGILPFLGVGAEVDGGASLWDGFASLLQFRLSSCLALSVALFAIGAFGVLARRNVIMMLICVEIMLNAVMLAFIAFARMHAASDVAAGLDGQIFALFIIAVAAAEAAVGLAIVVAYFRNRETVDTREIRSMQG